MLLDAFGRKIDYLRMSVTDRCNFRCAYCMPVSGIDFKQPHQILSYEAMAKIADVAGKLGIAKVRLTGGEPLARKNVETLVEMLNLTRRFSEITLTTNASLLTPPLAKTLKKNGLTRINISLDTLDPEKFQIMTRCGRLSEVLAGIEAAKEAELFPIKINMIIFSETSREEITSMRAFCKKNRLKLQLIKHYSLLALKEQETADFPYDKPGKCTDCNRLRLTADGHLKPCLCSDREIPVDFNDIEGSILEAVRLKPQQGTTCLNRSMHQIGG